MATTGGRDRRPPTGRHRAGRCSLAYSPSGGRSEVSRGITLTPRASPPCRPSSPPPFLTPELAQHLLAQPSLLEGREVEVTVLFADIRGYSRVCEMIGAEESVRWVSDVLGELSDCVRAEGGVLVDYIGDELMAMWGAPG